MCACTALYSVTNAGLLLGTVGQLQQQLPPWQTAHVCIVSQLLLLCVAELALQTTVCLWCCGLWVSCSTASSWLTRYAPRICMHMPYESSACAGRSCSCGGMTCCYAPTCSMLIWLGRGHSMPYKPRIRPFGTLGLHTCAAVLLCRLTAVRCCHVAVRKKLRSGQHRC
jgi:hypothetical protein